MSQDSYIFDTSDQSKIDFFPTAYGTTEGNEGYQDQFLPPDDDSSFIDSHEGKIANFWTGAYPDEKPLLEELGINVGHIWSKTKAALHPTAAVSSHIMDDIDLAGPIAICLLLGVSLLLRGKLHFSYIYGFAGVGSISQWVILNLMSEQGIDIYRVVSVFGYCLLPMVALAMLAIVFPLNGMIGALLAVFVTLWCTKSASLMFVRVLHMVEQRILVAFPVFLFYICFALMAVF